jgi:apolipoprotein N-acyltransferase
VVCATSGVTQVISPDGKRRAELPLMEDGVLVTHVTLRDEMTPYVRYGWLFPYLVSFLTILGTIILLIKRKAVPRETT